MRRRVEAGFVSAVILVIFALFAVGLIAAMVLDRMTTRGGEADQSAARLVAAQDALERFVTTAGRLPCPADPAADTGLEVQLTATTCTHPDGTLPWRTIGMKRDEAFDAWGWKISYRVYTGTNNDGIASVTQARGASLLDCDVFDPTPLPATGAGLCDAGTKATAPESVLTATRGLRVTDFGVERRAAYVLVSHGESGYGAYSVTGVQRLGVSPSIPRGDELKNTAANTSNAVADTFVVKAFSGADVTPSDNDHFDDIVAYRTLADVVIAAGLTARNWPDPGAVFSEAAVEAASGQQIVGMSTTVNTIDFGSYSVSGFTGTTATTISFDDTGGTGGLGVCFMFGPFCVFDQIVSGTGQKLRFDFDAPTRRQFAITLNAFGRPTTSGKKYTERAEVTFFVGDSQVGSASTLRACRDAEGLASFSVNAGVEFNRVEVRALAAVADDAAETTSAFAISEIAACGAGVPGCVTTLSSSSNACG